MDKNKPQADAHQKGLREESLTEATSVVTTTSQEPKKKIAGIKIIATIFGILLLIGGVAAGVYLVQRQQEIRERAASGSACNQHPDCILLDEPGNQGSYTANRSITYLFITAKDYHRFDAPGGDDGCYRVTINGNSLSWARYGSGPDCKDVSNIQIWLGTAPSPTTIQSPTPTPTTPPGQTPTPTTRITSTPTPTLPPQVSAQCFDVKAYDTNWNLLTASELQNLEAGNRVRFAVAGTATSGFFDKAQFTINGTTRLEITSKKPGSDEFYDEYLIPTGVTTFTVSAKIHHSTLGWF